VFIAVAWQQTRRDDATRHGTSEFGSARRKHRFVHCCVIAGMCFEVTVLAWRKYGTIQIYEYNIPETNFFIFSERGNTVDKFLDFSLHYYNILIILLFMQEDTKDQKLSDGPTFFRHISQGEKHKN
jgi:hypothetical protein